MPVSYMFCFVFCLFTCVCLDSCLVSALIMSFVVPRMSSDWSLILFPLWFACTEPYFLFPVSCLATVCSIVSYHVYSVCFWSLISIFLPLSAYSSLPITRSLPVYWTWTLLCILDHLPLCLLKPASPALACAFMFYSAHVTEISKPLHMTASGFDRNNLFKAGFGKWPVVDFLNQRPRKNGDCLRQFVSLLFDLPAKTWT